MSTASISIDRTSLSKTALVLGTSRPLLLDAEGLETPTTVWRYTYMPDSPDVHGSELIAAAREHSSLPFTALIVADSAGELQSSIDDLDEALGQFSYSVTQTFDGVARTWAADPGSWSRGAVTEGEQAAFLCHVNVTIPVYPIPSTS